MIEFFYICMRLHGFTQMRKTTIYKGNTYRYCPYCKKFYSTDDLKKYPISKYVEILEMAHDEIEFIRKENLRGI